MAVSFIDEKKQEYKRKKDLSPIAIHSQTVSH